MAAPDTAHDPLRSAAIPIAALVKSCLLHFNTLVTSLNTSSDYRVFSRAVSDASGRFKIWSGNIGAHHTGRRSLDHRLRDASHLQEHVLKLLSSLMQSLSDGMYDLMCLSILAKISGSNRDLMRDPNPMGPATIQ